MTVFLSFSAADSEIAQTIASGLRRAGVQVYMDAIASKPVGRLLDRVLASGTHPTRLALLFSKRSIGTDYIAEDWHDGITDEVLHGRSWILPLCVDDCELPEHLPSSMIWNLTDPETREARAQVLCSTHLSLDASPATSEDQ